MIDEQTRRSVETMCLCGLDALRTDESQRKDRRYCENESNLKVIQSVMGHSDIQTTMDIYAECTQEKKDEVFANLNGKIMIK